MPWLVGMTLQGGAHRQLQIHPLGESRRRADELYDLERDPYELRNLASDPVFAKVREAMKKELRKVAAEALGI